MLLRGSYNDLKMTRFHFRVGSRRAAWALVITFLALQAAPAFAGLPGPGGARMIRPGVDEAPAVAPSPDPERPLLIVTPADPPLPPIRDYATPAIPPRRVGISLVPLRIFSKYFSFRESLSAP